MKMTIAEVNAAIKGRHAVCLSAGELVNVCADLKKRGYINTVIDIALIDTPRDPYQYSELVIYYKGRLEKVAIVYSANISKLPFSAEKLTDTVLYACDDMHDKKDRIAPVSYVYASTRANNYIALVIDGEKGGILAANDFDTAIKYADAFITDDKNSADLIRYEREYLEKADHWRLVSKNKKLC